MVHLYQSHEAQLDIPADSEKRLLTDLIKTMQGQNQNTAHKQYLISSDPEAQTGPFRSEISLDQPPLIIIDQAFYQLDQNPVLEVCGDCVASSVSDPNGVGKASYAILMRSSVQGGDMAVRVYNQPSLLVDPTAVLAVLEKYALSPPSSGADVIPLQDNGHSTGKPTGIDSSASGGVIQLDQFRPKK